MIAGRPTRAWDLATLLFAVDPTLEEHGRKVYR
jgi:hypothetical protein